MVREHMINLDTSNIRKYLAEQPDIILAYLFGSVARGEATAQSDIDIAILIEPTISRETQLEKQIEFLTALDQMIPQEVQVVLLNNAAPILVYQVIRDGIILYQRSRDERVEFTVLAMKRYFDVKPMLAFFNQTLQQRIKEKGLGRRKRNPERALEAARRVHKRLTSTSRSYIPGIPRE